jgi:HEPN domain-containing protein
MSDPTDPLAWVHRAEEDWLLACSALRRKVPLTYGATFHAQQCAEKYLKALLVSRQQAFPRTHDMIALYDLCLRNSLRVPVDPDQLERLAAYAVQVRYPGEDPTPDEARVALQIAQAVRRWARAVLRPSSQQP